MPGPTFPPLPTTVLRLVPEPPEFLPFVERELQEVTSRLGFAENVETDLLRSLEGTMASLRSVHADQTTATVATRDLGVDAESQVLADLGANVEAGDALLGELDTSLGITRPEFAPVEEEPPPEPPPTLTADKLREHCHRLALQTAREIFIATGQFTGSLADLERECIERGGAI